MKLFGTLILTGLVTLFAIAIGGASAASANQATALCKANELPCAEANHVKELHMTLVGTGFLHGLTPLFNVLCLSGLVLGEVLGLASAGTGGQQTHLSKLDFTSCGTNSTHTNCEIKQLELPVLVDVLKTAANLGTATGLNGETLVKCNIPFIGTIDCIYEGAGLGFDVKSAGGTDGHGMLNAEATPVNKTAGSGFCSEESTITQGLLEPLGRSSVVCTAHEVPCAWKNEASELALQSSAPPVLLNSIANVECESSSVSAKALATEASGSEPFDSTALTWSGCHTQGAADNCTVETKSLPTLGISQTSLNVGTASTSGSAIHVDCDILGGLVELDCNYPLPASFEVKGALQEEGVGSGKFSASKASVKVTEAKKGCPETAKWDLAYEATKHVYLVKSLAEDVYISS